MKKLKKLALLLGLVFAAAGCGSDAPVAKEVQAVATDGQLQVHFIDVGQADCALLASDGHYMVIDGGNNDDAETIVDYLQAQGVKKLDAVVGTHPHEDHIGSLDTIIKTFDVEAVYMPKILHTSKTFEDVLDAIAEKGLQIKSPKPGECFSFGGLMVEFFGPQQEYEDFNNNSIVLKVTAGETSFLFTGDAEEIAEQDMLRAGCDLEADVLKVGHHGSTTSTSDAFLQEVSPQYAVISVGTENKYGHPHREIMEKLQNSGIEIYRTDRQGTVFCSTDGKEITFYSEPAAAGAPSEALYIGNKKSKKFHKEDCASLPEESNRMYFADCKEAVSMGYAPCGACKP